jgi:hypothetical protein
MSGETSDPNKKWFVRGVGVFCGATLGLALAASGSSLIGEVQIGSATAIAVFGAIVGGALGYAFPHFAEMLIQIVTAFLRS